MKRPFFASVALATLITAPAIAADLPRPVPVSPVYPRPSLLPVAVPIWTGCYVGGNLGGRWAGR
jgi:outer membrane immunogenic protein